MAGRLVMGPNGMPTAGMPQMGPMQRFNNGLNSFFDRLSGPQNPYLSPQEQDVSQQRQKMAMIAALLQNSGPAPKNSRGMLAPFGAAITAGQQAGDQFSADALRQKLAAAQMGQYNQQAQNRTNVQSQFADEQGRMWTIRRDGTAEPVTDKDGNQLTAADSYQFLNTPGGGILAGSRRGGTAGQPVEEVLSAEEGTQQAATRAGAERTATERAAADVETTQTAPKEIQALNDELARNEEILAGLEAGEFQTGPFAGRLPALNTNQQLFDVYSGRNVIEAISSATFGALSEGEREFLRTTVPSRDKTEQANMKIIRERNRILRKAIALEQSRLSGASERTGSGIAVPQDDDPLGIR